LNGIVPRDGLVDAWHLEGAHCADQQAHCFEIQRCCAVGRHAPILEVERTRHVGGFGEIGRPIAVAKQPKVGGHVPRQGRGRRGVGLLEVVDRIAVSKCQVGELAPVERHMARTADKASGAAQLVVVLGQQEVRARPICAEESGRKRRKLQPAGRQRQERVEFRQLTGQSRLGERRQRRADLRGAHHVCARRLDLGLRSLERIDRLRQRVEAASACHHLADRRKRVDRGAACGR